MAEKENTTNNQEITPEAYAALKTELDAAKAAVDTATQPLKERIASLEADVKARDEVIATGKAVVEEKEKSFASLSQNFDQAIGAFKGAVLKANPLIPPELVTGATVAEITASVEKATAIVNKVKEGLAKETQTQTIPPGAPGRTEPDTSGYSTTEKIKLGIEKAKKKKES